MDCNYNGISIKIIWVVFAIQNNLHTQSMICEIYFGFLLKKKKKKKRIANIFKQTHTYIRKWGSNINVYYKLHLKVIISL